MGVRSERWGEFLCKFFSISLAASSQYLPNTLNRVPTVFSNCIIGSSLFGKEKGLRVVTYGCASPHAYGNMRSMRVWKYFCIRRSEAVHITTSAKRGSSDFEISCGNELWNKSWLIWVVGWEHNHNRTRRHTMTFYITFAGFGSGTMCEER